MHLRLHARHNMMLTVLACEHEAGKKAEDHLYKHLTHTRI